jgi:hypothetical protein
MDAQFPRGYARSRGAPGLYVSLVPALQQCLSPNNMHGAPLSFGSCSSPRTVSSFLTTGTPTSNGAAANFIGFVSYKFLPDNPFSHQNETDVRMRVRLTDVRKKSDLSDYTGQLQVRGGLRITDRLNGSLQNEAATEIDTELPATVPCTATTPSFTGANCELTTTLNATVPGTIVKGKRATWQFGQIKVFDGGAGGVAGASDATLYAVQGLYIP